MFKLESYITPIILSYVDKYIKNFRPEDSQVSLWGGDASFHNLDLRLEVLEQELQLPFSFVSGHIHELLIHVPWTKLASEPITVTINTIECILKLRGAESPVNTEKKSVPKEKHKKQHSKRLTPEAPPGYVQLLINKIVSNIRIYCNNLILKYVEEDIVLSMNVKLLTFESANEKWEPAYTDVSPVHIIIRKLIAVTDLTVCLDKRNASGKIDVYQEPMLYRCSMVIHFLRHYYAAIAKRASTTRLDIYCNSMEFSMTEQQIPMLVRIMLLVQALQQKEIKSEVELNTDSDGNAETTNELSIDKQTLAGWAWSFVPSILPTTWDEELDKQQKMLKVGHVNQIGFYVDDASLTFKVSEYTSDKGGYYSQRKLKYWPLISFRLQGIFMECIVLGKHWTHVGMGISQMLLVPIGHCSCAIQDVFESVPVPEYLKAGAVTNFHKSDSLFDVEAVENKGQSKNYDTTWEAHIEKNNEATLLERSPALAVDYVYQVKLRDDSMSETLSEIGSDLEFSNTVTEKALLRTVVAPLRVRLCSGFMHRLSSLQAAASAYDYIPYSTPKPEPEFADLPPANMDDFDYLSENISVRTVQLTVLAPVIEFQLMDHPYFEATRKYLFKKRKKISSVSPPSNQSLIELPLVTLECQCIDIKITNPMYTKRLLQTTSQVPNAPQAMFDACHTELSVKIIGFCTRLLVSNRQFTILTPTNASFHSKSILMPQYWLDPNIPHQQITFESDSLSITGTNPKIFMVAHILDKFMKRDCEDCINYVNNSSILQDVLKDYGLVYLEICIEGFRFKKVTTRTTVTLDIKLGSIKAFIFEPIDFVYSRQDILSVMSANSNFFSSREIQQVLIVSGPEFTDHHNHSQHSNESPLLTVTVQYPRTPEDQVHPPIVLFNLRDIRICVDPLLCRWLLYTPKNVPPKTEVLFEMVNRKLSRSFSDISTFETPRKAKAPYESIHSSLEHATEVLPAAPSNNYPVKEEEVGIDVQEQTYNFLKKWFDVWKGLLLYGDISQCTVYFPVKSLSAVGSQGIQQAVEKAMKKDHPPDILIFSLPYAKIRNSVHREDLRKYVTKLPVILPDNLWTKSKSSFPWSITVSDLTCYTWQNGKRYDCLAPVGLTSTVGLATKASKTDIGADEKLGNLEDFNVNLNNTKLDLATLGVCVHIDMTPIIISISELQVCLIASILHGLMEVLYNITPDPPSHAPAKPETVPVPQPQESTVSPTLLKESTMESMSERMPHVVTDNIETDNVKLTAWIQWTITRFSIQLLAHKSKDISSKDFAYVKNKPKLKFVIDAEDIVSSLDFQNVYLKIKSKIGSASIMHFVKDKGMWKEGEFLGFVMRANEDEALSERQENTSFANITITRASCNHTHSLWGTSKKNLNKEFEEKLENQQIHSRYITEIVVNLQPIDLLISPSTLKNYFLVLEPLLNLPALPTKTQKTIVNTIQVSNRTLPLTYLEFHGFRVIMPTVEFGKNQELHDTCMFQVKEINLSPSAVNPICRLPVRPDIYQQAAQARILNVPGSDVEDRQYQLDITSIAMSSGSWSEISRILKNSGKGATVLRTMSENPALEWNNLEKSSLGKTPEVHFWPVVAKFDISIIAAPAMIYKHDVVCGHSIEINFMSDVKLTISLGQIKLLMALANESSYALSGLASNKNVKKRPKMVYPYPVCTDDYETVEETEVVDVTRDSGIETSDFRSTTHSMKTKESFYLKKMSDVSEKSVLTTAGVGKATLFQSFIPLDILVTGGKISFVLYEYDTKRNMGRGAHQNYESGSEKGYDASEEGSVDEQRMNVKVFNPLLYMSVSQPNAFLSDTQIDRKIQVTCFDVSIKICDANAKTPKGIPSEEDFQINLLETKCGAPNQETGVPPAFFTLKWTKGIGKTATLDVDIARPTRILCSVSRWMYILQVKQKLVDCLSSGRSSVVVKQTSEPPPQPREVSEHKTTDHYSKFNEIRDMLFGVNNLSIRFAQIVLVVQTDNGVEVTLSIGKLVNHLSISNRPEKLINLITFDSITLGITKDGESRLMLNPWTVTIEISLFWESWQSENSNPQVQISIETDYIMLDISPVKIYCLNVLVAELTHFLDSLPIYVTEAKEIREKPPTKSPIGEKEQHYKDDLRAGAFQFVDSNSNNIEELPMPYQVMFWNRGISAMAWRYPQPRALTKVRVFPVPFKITTEGDDDLQILCHLEYWSDCHGTYQPFTQFYLSESEIRHLDIPKTYPQPAVACTWRVLLTTPLVKNYDQSRVLISPRALAGCIRIDSYFNKNLIPELTVALHIGSINLSFYNYFDKKKEYKMPDVLRDYTIDLLIPEYQQFLTITVDNANAYLAIWNFETIVLDVNASTRCTVLDYGFLTQQVMIEPFLSKVEISLSKCMAVNFIAKPIHVVFGAAAAHTLAVSAQMWTQCFDNEIETDLIIMTHYAICNDTNVNLRFGQVGLEDIFLPSRVCHLYSWRSQKCKQMIRVALEENEWVWSEPFRIDEEGTQMYKIIGDTTVIVVTVKNLSATQKQVIFSGQLAVCNTLLEHFEMKVVEAVDNDRQREFKMAPSHIIRGKSTPPSLLIDLKKSYFLRLRFFGLESAWSGDIPLMENTKCAQPWLVKVPLQERGQFLSIWCKIVVQQFPKGTKILTTLWPLFMVRSNLPVSAKVHIETPTLNVHLESTVHGLGKYQQLYCPGTIDHSHQLTFQIDNSTTASNPYVPLNYSLVDQKLFFKKPEKEDIDDILKIINSYDKSDWPYFKDDIEDVDFTADEQPLTHVQVRYQNACEHSSALLVELLPWCLLVNTLGCSIAIIVNEKELCRVRHHGLVTPPKLEETFYVGVGIGGTWNLSSPLQLSKSDWSQTFYMPQITGNIPVEGSIKTVVKCDPYICMASIISSVVNEIRLLKICSSHVITSHMNFQLQVICFSVPESETNLHMPRYFDKHSFTLPSHLNEGNVGMSIIKWYLLGHNSEENSDYALYVSFSTNSRYSWSCPVRVDKHLIRRSVVIQTESTSIPIVLVSQEHKGQIYLSVHHDMFPQLLIENQSGTKLYCAQGGVEYPTVVNDSEHFTWLCSIENGRSSYYNMPLISERFPDIPQNPTAENLLLASDPESDPQGFLWSTPINVTSFNDQFVRIPFYGDVKVSVKYSVHAIRISIESVSQVEISARDIRVRLSLHEKESRSGQAQKRNSYTDVKDSESSSTVNSAYFSAEESATTSSLIDDHHHRHRRKIESETPLSGNKAKGKNTTDCNIVALLNGITFTYSSDLENGGAEKVEVISLNLDNVALTVSTAEISQICLSISDIQIDNQLYSRGSFDFPVLFIGQRKRQIEVLRSLNVPILQLVRAAQENCLCKFNVNVETWTDRILQKNLTSVKDVDVKIEPLSLFGEDVFILKLVEYCSVLNPAKLVLWKKETLKVNYKLCSMPVAIPHHVIFGSIILAKPLSTKTFTVQPISLLLSVHSSIKLYLALDQSPLYFGKFDKVRLFTTNYRLGHALTMHYLSGAIFGAGWVVGSLELIGSPGGLARAMGTGLRDFVSLPYNGLVQGPWAFLRGVSYGSASLMKHITAGTLHSVTKLASSVARNLDRLTLDEEHLRRAEESRRQRPQGVTQGFMQGLTGFGITLLGAVGGIAHHPLQSVMADGASPRSLVAGVGKGLVGVFTKPLSGAAELVALTGQGILQGAGWDNLPEPRNKPVLNHIYSAPNSVLKYKWKFIQPMTNSNILFVLDATAITNLSQYDAVALVLTTEALFIIDTDEDMSQRVLTLSELTGVNNNDPTLLCLKVDVPKVETKKATDEEFQEMDPASRARVADYVRSTIGLMQLPDNLSPEHSEMSISPDQSPIHTPNYVDDQHCTLTFYVNPQSRNYFLNLLSLAKQQSPGCNFPVL